MKWKKLAAAALSVFMIGGSFSDYTPVIRDSAIVADAADSIVIDGVRYSFNSTKSVYSARIMSNMDKCEILNEYDGYPVTSIGIDTTVKNDITIGELVIPKNVANINTYYIDPDGINYDDYALNTLNHNSYKLNVLKFNAYNNQYYSVKDNVLYKADNNGNLTAVRASSDLTGSVTIQDNTTSIDVCAFAGTKITKITIPDSVTSIYRFAFLGCTDLTSVELPESVSSLGDGAFKDCTNLSSIKFSKSLSALPAGCFYNCKSLKGEFVIPRHIVLVDKYCFLDCDDLTTITIKNADCYLGKKSVFSKTVVGDYETTIEDRSGTLKAYDYSSIISLTSAQTAPYYCRNLFL